MRAVLTVAIVTLSLLFSSLGLVQPASAADPGTGGLEGTILDPDGVGIDDLQIMLAAVPEGGGDPVSIGATSTGPAPDGGGGPAHGYYHADLPPGTYELVIAESDTVIPGPDDGLFTVVADQVIVADPFTYWGVEGSSGSINGVVRGPGGAYLDDVNVEAFPADDPDAGPAASALTYEGPGQPHGYYSLELPSGTYRIRFTPADGSPLRSAYYPRQVQSQGYPLDLDPMTLRTAGGPGFTGHVMGSDGAAIPFPRVVVFRRKKSTWSAGVVSMGARDGSFAVPAHPGSTVTVRVSAPGYSPAFLGGGSTLPEQSTEENSRLVSTTSQDLGTFALTRALGGGAAQDLPYCDRHVLPANDDDSTGAVTIPFALSFFGQGYESLYVNNNGNVTFNESSYKYTPEDLTTATDRPIIAPFFADVDTRDANSLETTWGASPDGQTLCVDWTQVGYFGSHADKLNSFQLLLTRATGDGRVDGDFDITFNYDHVQWETGDASEGEGGMGGISAAAGFSAGTGLAGTFVQLPGSFENGALLDGGPNALVSGFQGSITPGRYVFQVRNSGVADTLGGMHGVVRASSDTGELVAGAYVQACRQGGSFCRTTTTTGNGTYTFTALPVGSYTISVSPPDGSSFFPASGTGEVVAGEDSEASLVVLQAPRPMPSGVSLTNADEDSGVMAPYVPESGPPVVHYLADLALAVDGCPGIATPTVTQTVGGQVQHGGPIALTEGPAGHYTATIPATYPAHGDGAIVTNIPATCDGDPVAFDIYIDPSGVVTDQYGRALSGATVTLRRADSEAGPYGTVADGSAVMSPANRTNPDHTDGAGFFRWDVLAGWYKVGAQSAGCDDVETPGMEVPPARLDLLVKMTCTAAMPAPTTVPVLSGTAQVGQVLSVTQGAWPSGLSFQKVEWLRGATVVGTGTTYSLRAADQGQAVTARVYAKRPDYSQADAGLSDVSFTPATYEVQSGVVAAAPGGGGGGATAPTASARPSIGGVAKVGKTLTADPGSWDRSGLTFSYQWQREAAPIQDATAADYTPSAADLGKKLTVTVTARKVGAPSGTATSDPVTVALGDAPVALAPPVITGEPGLGSVLTVSTGSWDVSDLSFGYQWLRDGTPIAGATSSAHTVTDADQGHDLGVLVTALKEGYANGTAEADAVGVIAPQPVETVTSARLGTKHIKTGQHGHLTVTVARADGEPAVGRVVIRVDGQTTRAATLAANDHGKRSFTLPKLGAGVHRIVAAYGGDATAKSSRSKVVRLRVQRKHHHHHHRVMTPTPRIPSIF